MESLKDKKFQGLSHEEMLLAVGGKWGWVCDNWEIVTMPDVSKCELYKIEWTFIIKLYNRIIKVNNKYFSDKSEKNSINEC